MESRYSIGYFDSKTKMVTYNNNKYKAVLDETYDLDISEILDFNVLGIVEADSFKISSYVNKLEIDGTEFSVASGHLLQPGDTYIAKRNTDWKLLTCRTNDLENYCVHPNERAYSYDTAECHFIVGMKKGDVIATAPFRDFYLGNFSSEEIEVPEKW